MRKSGIVLGAMAFFAINIACIQTASAQDADKKVKTETTVNPQVTPQKPALSSSNQVDNTEKKKPCCEKENCDRKKKDNKAAVAPVKEEKKNKKACCEGQKKTK